MKEVDKVGEMGGEVKEEKRLLLLEVEAAVSAKLVLDKLNEVDNVAEVRGEVQEELQGKKWWLLLLQLLPGKK